MLRNFEVVFLFKIISQLIKRVEKNKSKQGN